MIDLVFRCFSRARWITVATSRGIYDAAGNVQPGFEVDEIGDRLLSGANNYVAGITAAGSGTLYITVGEGL